MSWTRVTLEVDVDGDKTDARETTADLLEQIIDDTRVIACSGLVEQTHDDSCDAFPCTCEGAA